MVVGGLEAQEAQEARVLRGVRVVHVIDIKVEFEAILLGIHPVMDLIALIDSHLILLPISTHMVHIKDLDSA